MEKLSRILHDLDQGNINVESAKQQVLDLFAVVGSDVINSLSDLDGKTMLVKFKVSKFQSKITLDEV